MKVRDRHYTAIWSDKDHIGSVNVIDQKKLPFSFEIISLTRFEDFCIAIEDMTVRGAPLIGITAAYAMYMACRECKDSGDFKTCLKEYANRLQETRPTAVNLFHAIQYMLEAVKNIQIGSDQEKTAFDAAEKYFVHEVDCCRKIGEAGLPLIEKISAEKGGEAVNILTHCNAGWLACGDYGTATAPIYLAHNKGIKLHVWVDETRPRNQGSRLTAWELGMHGVPHTVIADNTGGHLMQHGMVDMVIVGSDRTTKNGDVANKIGTYLKALSAKDNNIPFYVALPVSTIDFSLSDGIKEIPIEQRDAGEVRMIEGFADNHLQQVLILPENSPAVNFGFDVTPARLITGLITERGICAADEKSISGLLQSR